VGNLKNPLARGRGSESGADAQQVIWERSDRRSARTHGLWEEADTGSGGDTNWRFYMKSAYFFFVMFSLVFLGCPHQPENSPEIGFYPTCEYAIDFSKHPDITLSTASQWHIEFYVSKPDLEGLKTYITDKILPELRGSLQNPQNPLYTVIMKKLLYTHAVLNAWLQMGDINIIREQFFYRREVYDVIF
jgi:hypothetical protein